MYPDRGRNQYTILSRWFTNFHADNIERHLVDKKEEKITPSNYFAFRQAIYRLPGFFQRETLGMLSLTKNLLHAIFQAVLTYQLISYLIQRWENFMIWHLGQTSTWSSPVQHAHDVIVYCTPACRWLCSSFHCVHS